MLEKELTASWVGHSPDWRRFQGPQRDLLASLVICSVFPSQQQTLCFAPPPATTARTASALIRASSVMGRITVKTTAMRKAVKVLKVGASQALKNNCITTPQEHCKEENNTHNYVYTQQLCSFSFTVLMQFPSQPLYTCF